MTCSPSTRWRAPEQVAQAVAEALAAQREWAARPAVERAGVLRRAAQLIDAQTTVLADWLQSEAGSAPGKAAFEAGLVSAEFWAAADTAMMPNGQLLRTGRPRLSFSRRLPVGVVGVISPFNFPAILSARSIAPALALGNAVVHKPDPRTTVTGGLFFAAVLEEAGLPAGLFGVVPGGADVGSALVEHPRVPVISFTGSTAGGARDREAGRGAAEARAPRARRQQRAARAAGCGRGGRLLRRRVGLVPPPGPDLHDDRPAPGARRPVRRSTSRG